MKCILSAFHGGLGDNLQFSTLPEEFFRQKGIETYIRRDSFFRNSEIFDLVWGYNPYVKGISDGDWNCGDTPGRHRVILSNCISNWEALHGLAPTNIYPKIYYTPKYLDGYKDTYLVDISAISVKYSNEFILKIIDNLKKTLQGNFVNIRFTKSITSDQIIYESGSFSNVEVTSLTHYCDLLNSCKGIICLFSGINSLSSAIKNEFNKFLDIKTIIDKNTYNDCKSKSLFIFDNVDYLM